MINMIRTSQETRIINIPTIWKYEKIHRLRKVWESEWVTNLASCREALVLTYPCVIVHVDRRYTLSINSIEPGGGWGGVSNT